MESANPISFEIKGQILYNTDEKKLTRNVTEININGQKVESNNNKSLLDVAKEEIVKTIAELKNLSKQMGGYSYPKNSTEYKKQKQNIKTKTLRFKSRPNNKTYKK